MKQSLRVIDCNMCDLRSQEHHITPVAGSGHPNGVMLVAYSPDEETNLMGAPYSSRAEIHFRSLMERAGVDGYFTYLVKCHGEPKACHIKTCKKTWLKAERLEMTPHTIVALGSAVAEVLIKDGVLCFPWYSTHKILSSGRHFDDLTVEFLKRLKTC